MARDRTLVLDGKLYEAPVALIGKQVELLYHEKDEGRVELHYNGQTHGFIPSVNLHVNCRVKRDRNNNAQVTSSDQPSYKGGSLWSKPSEDM